MDQAATALTLATLAVALCTSSGLYVKGKNEYTGTSVNNVGGDKPIAETVPADSGYANSGYGSGDETANGYATSNNLPLESVPAASIHARPSANDQNSLGSSTQYSDFYQPYENEEYSETPANKQSHESKKKFITLSAEYPNWFHENGLKSKLMKMKKTYLSLFDYPNLQHLVAPLANGFATIAQLFPGAMTHYHPGYGNVYSHLRNPSPKWGLSPSEKFIKYVRPQSWNQHTSSNADSTNLQTHYGDDANTISNSNVNNPSTNNNHENVYNNYNNENYPSSGNQENASVDDSDSYPTAIYNENQEGSSAVNINKGESYHTDSEGYTLENLNEGEYKSYNLPDSENSATSDTYINSNSLHDGSFTENDRYSTSHNYNYGTVGTHTGVESNINNINENKEDETVVDSDSFSISNTNSKDVNSDPYYSFSSSAIKTGSASDQTGQTFGNNMENSNYDITNSNGIINDGNENSDSSLGTSLSAVHTDHNTYNINNGVQSNSHDVEIVDSNYQGNYVSDSQTIGIENHNDFDKLSHVSENDATPGVNNQYDQSSHTLDTESFGTSNNEMNEFNTNSIVYDTISYDNASPGLHAENNGNHGNEYHDGEAHSHSYLGDGIENEPLHEDFQNVDHINTNVLISNPLTDPYDKTSFPANSDVIAEGNTIDKKEQCTSHSSTSDFDTDSSIVNVNTLNSDTTIPDHSNDYVGQVSSDTPVESTLNENNLYSPLPPLVPTPNIDFSLNQDIVQNYRNDEDIYNVNQGSSQDINAHSDGYDGVLENHEYSPLTVDNSEATNAHGVGSSVVGCHGNNNTLEDLPVITAVSHPDLELPSSVPYSPENDDITNTNTLSNKEHNHDDIPDSLLNDPRDPYRHSSVHDQFNLDTDKEENSNGEAHNNLNNDNSNSHTNDYVNVNSNFLADNSPGDDSMNTYIKPITDANGSDLNSGYDTVSNDNDKYVGENFENGDVHITNSNNLLDQSSIASGFSNTPELDSYSIKPNPYTPDLSAFTNPYSENVNDDVASKPYESDVVSSYYGVGIDNSPDQGGSDISSLYAGESHLKGASAESHNIENSNTETSNTMESSADNKLAAYHGTQHVSNSNSLGQYSDGANSNTYNPDSHQNTYSNLGQYSGSDNTELESNSNNVHSHNNGHLGQYSGGSSDSYNTGTHYQESNGYLGQYSGNSNTPVQISNANHLQTNTNEYLGTYSGSSDTPIDSSSDNMHSSKQKNGDQIASYSGVKEEYPSDANGVNNSTQYHTGSHNKKPDGYLSVLNALKNNLQLQHELNAQAEASNTGDGSMASVNAAGESVAESSGDLSYSAIGEGVAVAAAVDG